MQLFFQYLINALQWGSFYALIALGYSMVYGVLMLFNFAHGDVFMVGSYIGFGVATALAQLRPEIALVAVEPDDADDFRRSIAAGRRWNRAAVTWSRPWCATGASAIT